MQKRKIRTCVTYPNQLTSSPTFLLHFFQMLTDLVACSSRAHIEIVSTDTARYLEFTSPGSPEDEELLLNAVAACTNITFYACKVRTYVCPYMCLYILEVTSKQQLNIFCLFKHLMNSRDVNCSQKSISILQRYDTPIYLPLPQRIFLYVWVYTLVRTCTRIIIIHILSDYFISPLILIKL